MARQGAPERGDQRPPGRKSGLRRTQQPLVAAHHHGQSGRPIEDQLGIVELQLGLASDCVTAEGADMDMMLMLAFTRRVCGVMGFVVIRFVLMSKTTDGDIDATGLCMRLPMTCVMVMQRGVRYPGPSPSPDHCKQQDQGHGMPQGLTQSAQIGLLGSPSLGQNQTLRVPLQCRSCQCLVRTAY